MQEIDLASWQIRVDIRCAVDLPVKDSSTLDSLPSTFAECGWTIYDDTPPDNSKVKISKIIHDDNNPIFNEQFVVSPPSSIHSKGKQIINGKIIIFRWILVCSFTR